MRNEVTSSAKFTFSDLPEAEGMEWAKKIPEHSLVSFDGYQCRSRRA